MEFIIISKGSPEELIVDEKLLTQVMINILKNAADVLRNTKTKKIVIGVSGGSTVGLDLSRKIMRLHKGTITVFSKPEKQTTFTLNF